MPRTISMRSRRLGDCPDSRANENGTVFFDVRLATLCVALVLLSAIAPQPAHPQSSGTKPAKTESAPVSAKPALPTASTVPDARQSGGEPDGIVQVANLVYAGTKSSRCFADHFLVKAEKETTIATSRRFHAIKLHSTDIYEFPLLIMTGEGDFQLSDAERQSLRRYVERGGLLLASAGCSSTPWDRAFRREMVTVFRDQKLQPVDMQHPMFHTVYEIKDLRTKHGRPRPLEAVSIGGRLGVIYSQDGLNDTEHTQGCCCCGGNELLNAAEINVNILAYALMY